MSADVDLALLDLTAHAMSGNLEPLAQHIESGGNLDRPTREFLAAYLRGEIKFKRGNRRTYFQEAKEQRAVSYVRSLRFHYAVLHGSRGSLARAVRTFLDKHPEMSEETLKTYMKRHKDNIWQSAMKDVDRVRAEILDELQGTMG